jgi:hypothetical protein
MPSAVTYMNAALHTKRKPPRSNPLWPLGVEKKSRPTFDSLRDPTLLISGLESPWPFDYLKDLPARTADQTCSDRSQPDPGVSWGTLPAVLTIQKES